MSERICVLIVDDQKLFAESLQKVLQVEGVDFASVQIALSAKEAIGRLRTLKPHVILVDVHMPEMDGIEFTRRIHSEFPGVRILMLTAFGHDEYVRAALAGGASGYLLKDISSAELIRSIQSTHEGTAVLSYKALDSLKRRSEYSVPEWFLQMSPRERGILLLIVRGYSNEEIAEQVCLGLQTVRNYTSNIYSKMQVDNRFQAMRKAMEARIRDSLPEDPLFR